MKQTSKILLAILFVVCLTGMLTAAVSAITITIHSFNEAIVNIPVPVQGCKPDTDTSGVTTILKYNGSVTAAGKYEIKSINWYEANGSTKAEQFSSAAGTKYVVKIILRMLDDSSHFMYKSTNSSLLINGNPAAVEDSDTSRELCLSAELTPVQGVALQTMYVNGAETANLWNNSIPGYAENDVKLVYSFPATLKNNGFSFRIRYVEAYYKKDSSNPYMTWGKTYGMSDLTDNGDGTYTLRATGIGDQPGRNMIILTTPELIPPTGKGAVGSQGASWTTFEFTDNVSDILKFKSLNIESVSDTAIENAADLDEIVLSPYYIHKNVSVDWEIPPSLVLHTADRREGVTGILRFKLRVFIDGKEITTTNNYVTPDEGKRYISTSFGPLAGKYGETKKVRIELYGEYAGSAADGAKTTDALVTREFSVGFKTYFQEDEYNALADLYKAIYVDGEKIPHYYASMQSYLPHTVEFEFVWPDDDIFLDEKYTFRMFVIQKNEHNLDSAAETKDVDSPLGKGYTELIKSDEYCVDGKDLYRYPVTVYGREDDSGNPEVRLWMNVFDKETGERITHVMEPFVNITFHDKQDIFGIQYDEDGDPLRQSFNYASVETWDSSDDAEYTVEMQNNGVAAELKTGLLRSFELRLSYLLPEAFMDAPANLRYGLVPKLYVKNGSAWKPVTITSENQLTERLYSLTYLQHPSTEEKTDQYKLELYVETPAGVETGTRIPYTFYVNVRFTNEDTDLTRGVYVNSTRYGESSPEVHLNAKAPVLEYQYYLPQKMYEAGYRISVTETSPSGTKTRVKPVQNDYGYYTYTGQSAINATPDGTQKPKVELYLYYHTVGQDLLKVGEFTPTLVFDATPVTVMGIELEDGEYILNVSPAVKTGTPTGSGPRFGYAWNNGGVLTLYNFKPLTYTNLDTNGIYKKNQGDLRIELIKTSSINLVSDSARYGIYCNNDLEMIGSGKLQINLRDPEGYTASNSKGINLTGGSLRLQGATLEIKAGKGIIVSGMGQTVTMSELRTADESTGTVTPYSPHIKIAAVNMGIDNYRDTVWEMNSGTLDINVTEYDGKLTYSPLYFSQKYYNGGASSILAGDGTSEWIYDYNTFYDRTGTTSIYEIDGTKLKSLRLVQGACIAIGDTVLTNGEYLPSNSTAVQTTAPASGGYAYNNDGDLVLNGFAYSGEGCITDKPSNPQGHIPSITTKITLEGENTVTNTGKTIGKPWNNWSGYHGIMAQNDLIFDGGGSLTTTGIFANYDLTVADADITVNAGSYRGVYLNNNGNTTSHSNELLINGGSLTVNSSGYAIDGYSKIRIVKGELTASSSSRAVNVYAGTMQYDLAETAHLTVKAGEKSSSASKIAYTDDESLAAATMNVKYLQISASGDTLEVEIKNYVVCNDAGDVYGVYDPAFDNINLIRVYLSNESTQDSYTDSGYDLSFWRILEGDTNYKIRITIQYDKGVTESEIAKNVIIKVPTINGTKTYPMTQASVVETGGRIVVTYNRQLVDPPAGERIDKLDLNLHGYMVGGDVANISVDDGDANLANHYSRAVYIGNTNHEDYVVTDGTIKADQVYSITVTAWLNDSYYPAADLALENIKLNGITARYMEYEIDDDFDYYELTMQFLLPKLERTSPVSGTVSSNYISEGAFTLQLLKDETVLYTATCTGNPADFRFEQVAAGTYTLRISKPGHVTRDYTAIVEDTECVIGDCQLRRKGDINNDSLVNVMDVLELRIYLNGPTNDYNKSMADYNENGSVDVSDLIALLADVYNGVVA